MKRSDNTPSTGVDNCADVERLVMEREAGFHEEIAKLRAALANAQEELRTLGPKLAEAATKERKRVEAKLEKTEAERDETSRLLVLEKESRQRQRDDAAEAEAKLAKARELVLAWERDHAVPGDAVMTPAERALDDIGEALGLWGCNAPCENCHGTGWTLCEDGSRSETRCPVGCEVGS